MAGLLGLVEELRLFALELFFGERAAVA